MRHVKRFKTIIDNNTITREDIVAMDSLLAEANTILNGTLELAA